MKVYMVLFDWSTVDDDAVEVELFDTYEKAYNRFMEIIGNEKNTEMSWAADAFNEDGIVKDEYIFDSETDGSNQDNLWWNLTSEDDWNVHVFLDLKTMEVK